MNIGMISAGGMILKPVSQQLMREGHRCRSHAFCSTFFAEARKHDYDLVVINWCARRKQTPELVERLRLILGTEVQILIVHVPANEPPPAGIGSRSWLRGPVSTQSLVNKICSVDVGDRTQQASR